MIIIMFLHWRAQDLKRQHKFVELQQENICWSLLVSCEQNHWFWAFGASHWSAIDQVCVVGLELTLVRGVGGVQGWWGSRMWALAPQEDVHPYQPAGPTAGLNLPPAMTECQSTEDRFQTEALPAVRQTSDASVRWEGVMSLRGPRGHRNGFTLIESFRQ